MAFVNVLTVVLFLALGVIYLAIKLPAPPAYLHTIAGPRCPGCGCSDASACADLEGRPCAWLPELGTCSECQVTPVPPTPPVRPLRVVSR